MFHHCMPLEFVSYDAIKAEPSYSLIETDPAVSDPRWQDILDKDQQANLWLAKEVGFYPHFCAVGNSDPALYMTGYDSQFRRVLSSSKDGNILRQPGEWMNDVLFTWDNLDGVFLNYSWWFCILNYNYEGPGPTHSDFDRRNLFRYSWNRAKWFRNERKNNGWTMFVTPVLDLRTARLVRCRNKDTKRLLEKMGFENVETFRMLLERW